MKIKCGKNAITINPYVENQRKKTYIEVTRKWDKDVTRLAVQIDNISLMTSTDGVD